MKQVKELLAQEMTRKEFLQVAGMAVLSLFGVSNFVTFLLHTSKSQSTSASSGAKNLPSSHGFGSRTFGN